MRRLYIVAGGTDGYVNIRFTFDDELANRVVEDNPETYGDEGCISSIIVPDDATYESLGISYPLEEDEDDDYEDGEDDE